MPRRLWLLLALSILVAPLSAQTPPPAAPPVAASLRGSNLQAALDAHPGQLLYLPPGDYEIETKLVINKPGTGIFGPGRIIQTNPAQPIIEVEHASEVQLRDLTLTRPAGKMDALASAIDARDCRNIRIEGVQVLDNRAKPTTIYLQQCPGAQVRNCLVQNYMRITVDDRTDSKDWGYAFACIDGTGIGLNDCAGALIQGNRIVELNLLPTREVQQKFGLGKFVKKNAVKGTIVSQQTWDAGVVSNWHQGSALVVTAPENSDCIQLLGNQIENAAQGIDIHADHVIVSQNIVNNAFIGMKAMHGARNVLILGNQFIKNDLWSIGLMPGAGSHAAGVPAHEGEKPEQMQANVDGGSIIANNIISDFGYGNAHWVWGDDGCPIRLDAGQKPINPALHDVLIEGNVVYDTGKDQVLVDGKPQVAPPRYKYAVLVAGDNGEIKGPVGMHFANNVLHPGSQGVSNVELKP